MDGHIMLGLWIRAKTELDSSLVQGFIKWQQFKLVSLIFSIFQRIHLQSLCHGKYGLTSRMDWYEFVLQKAQKRCRRQSAPIWITFCPVSFMKNKGKKLSTETTSINTGIIKNSYFLQNFFAFNAEEAPDFKPMFSSSITLPKKKKFSSLMQQREICSISISAMVLKLVLCRSCVQQIQKKLSFKS